MVVGSFKLGGTQDIGQSSSAAKGRYQFTAVFNEKDQDKGQKMQALPKDSLLERPAQPVRSSYEDRVG